MNNLILEKLKALGLTKSEAQIYLAILQLDRATVAKIANATGINRRNVYDSLSTLLDKGLIFQIVGEKEGLYAGVSPEKLVEVIQSKEMILSNILPDLTAKYRARKIREQALIYKGVDGFKNYLREVLRVGQNVYCIGAKGGWGDKKLGKFSQYFKEQRIKKKIKVYNLFDYEMKQRIIKKPIYTVRGEYRFLPPDFATNSAIDVFGDYVVTFTGLHPECFSDDVTLFVLVSRELAESWRIWFKFMWNFCKNQ